MSTRWLDAANTEDLYGSVLHGLVAVLIFGAAFVVRWIVAFFN